MNGLGVEGSARVCPDGGGWCVHPKRLGVSPRPCVGRFQNAEKVLAPFSARRAIFPREICALAALGEIKPLQTLLPSGIVCFFGRVALRKAEHVGLVCLLLLVFKFVRK